MSIGIFGLFALGIWFPLNKVYNAVIKTFSATILQNKTTPKSFACTLNAW